MATLPVHNFGPGRASLACMTSKVFFSMISFGFGYHGPCFSSILKPAYQNFAEKLLRYCYGVMEKKIFWYFFILFCQSFCFVSQNIILRLHAGNSILYLIGIFVPHLKCLVCLFPENSFGRNRTLINRQLHLFVDESIVKANFCCIFFGISVIHL